ncbi:MAG: carbamoyltransferase HypF [Methanomassiliicoccales archaeon]|nr:carbamoyltransferase HypF [Methanomassiliicoccales archaeon]
MRIVVRGIVQGVGFRPTVHRVATAMGLNGYVQNNGSNVVIEVDREADEFVSRLKAQLPPLAKIESLEVEEGLPPGELGKGFRIVPSQKGMRGVGIPNDVALCENCRRELFDGEDRRYLYPFTNCTDCGARFSIIEDLPYDREKTSMRAFPMCQECKEEYDDPSDRRFHHQTISCPRCGPTFYLMDKEGRRMEGPPIPTFASLLEEGRIGVCKGWGGMHICCTLNTLPRLRLWYRRKEKPFAVMVRDIDAVRRYGNPDEFESEHLRSSHRPIVLVPKVESQMTEAISPGLGNIGLFLPYTEMQTLLFSYLDEDALVMTSANVPSEPMVLSDEDALSLGAECYLMHDREIVNRCDDSVLRTFGKSTFFIRKSRGHIPSHIELGLGGTALGVGAQEHISGAVAYGGRAHLTQYIGDGSSYGVMEFLESALDYQMRLLGVREVQAVAVDLHPGYSTRRLGKRLAEEKGAGIVEVQHHHAHAAALMVDAGLEEMAVLTLDGTGYGADGVAWGGEVLISDFDSYKRVGHLQEFPLLGGEKAVYDVRRLAFSLAEAGGLETSYFEEREAEIMRKMAPSSPRTTAMGRLLDAVSCQLGVCEYRSYDGEPAMKLEPLLERGRDSVPIPISRRGNIIHTAEMFKAMAEAKGRPEDKARSLVKAVMGGLVDIAVEAARDKGVGSVGISGGVSYNRAISSMAKELVEAQGLKFVCHDRLPNGDGCIAVGQCAIALKRMK